MTSLLPSRDRHERTPARRGPDDLRADLATRRPLVLVATLGGALSAASTLLVCLAAGVVGWFLSDGGAHGEPRDGLRTGATAWLMGHGSGVSIDGVRIEAVPLGVTVICAWVLWRLGLRVGDSVSGHGPDLDELSDGQRDLTVPTAVLLLCAGYLLVAVVAVVLAATPETALSSTHVIGWSLALCLLAGAPGIAVGSGRAALWADLLPVTVRAASALARRIVVLWVGLSALALVVSFALDLSTAANVVSDLDTDAGGVVILTVVSLLLLPNAVAFSGAYLMGPGFAVGTGTLVAPGAVVLGPLPSFPLLAALPDEGTAAGWTTWLVVVAPLVAFLVVALHQRRAPLFTYTEAAVRGCAGGIVAGVLLALVTSLAGGAVGPGRMQDVAPYTFDVLLHAVTSFGIGGLLGAMAMTWWQRRALSVDIELDPRTA